MERLSISDFGPIKKADIELKKFNIFIGHTSAGKSAVAKLFSILNSSAFFTLKNRDIEPFKKLLKPYNIDFEFKHNTKIVFEKDGNTWTITNKTFETDWDKAEIFAALNTENGDSLLQGFLNILDERQDAKIVKIKTELSEFIKVGKNNPLLAKHMATILIDSLMSHYSNLCDPIYIPAERNLITSITDSIYDFVGSDINLPECIIEFGRLYQRAKIYISKLDILFMNVEVDFSNKQDALVMKNENNKRLPLNQSSSGFQTLTPLLSVFNYNIEHVFRDKLFVIEEPELSLFPTAQTDLLEYIIKSINKAKYQNNIIITTHSPYVLSVFDNAVLAHYIGSQKGKKQKTEKVIPSDTWITLDDISSHYFDHDGTVKDIIDEEYHSIGAEYIDEASNKTGAIFDKLSELR